SGGLQVRFLPVDFPLSPYFAAGWGVASGTFESNSYGGDFTDRRGDGQSHYVVAGVGVELTVPYFHFAVGYQFLLPYYNQVANEGVSDEAAQKLLARLMDEHRHGGILEVGCVF